MKKTRKQWYKKVIAMTLALNMMTSAISIAASAEKIYSDVPSISEEQSDDVCCNIRSYSLEEGLLLVMDVDGKIGHEIQPWGDREIRTDNLYVLTQEEIEGGIEYWLTDEQGREVEHWVEMIEKPKPEEPTYQDEETCTKEREENAQMGIIDNELGYELLDSLYGEQAVYNKAYIFYKGTAEELKQKLSDAKNVKRKFAGALSKEQKSSISSYINNLEKEIRYFQKRSNSFKNVIGSVKSEINRLTKSLDTADRARKRMGESDDDKLYMPPEYEGLSHAVDFTIFRENDNGYFDFWSSDHLKKALGIYQLNDQYYVYSNENIEDSVPLSDSDIIKDIMETYSVKNNETVLRSIKEEMNVYQSGIEFYERKAIELERIVYYLKEYKKSNLTQMTSQRKSLLTTYINTYNKANSYYLKRAAFMRSVLKTATSESERLIGLGIEEDKSRETGEYGFWKKGYIRGEFFPIFMYPSDTDKEPFICGTEDEPRYKLEP